MNNKIVEFISNIDSASLDTFLANAKIKTDLALDLKHQDYDYSWLNQVEQYLPFINNIVNMDFKTADISVVKSYENRFIKTLLVRLNDLLIQEQKKFEHFLQIDREKYFTSQITSCLDGEDIAITISVNTHKKEESKLGESYGLSLKERIERVIKITHNLLNSSLMEALKDTTLVPSPINKTPFMEEEANYRKALELYNYIDEWDEKTNDVNSDISKELDDNIALTSYLEYQVLNNCLKEPKSENVYRLFLERLIEQMVLESSMDEKSFKRLLTKKFEEEYEKKKNREKNIQSIFLKNIDEYNKQVKDALRALKN